MRSIKDYDIFNREDILICNYCHSIINKDEAYVTKNGNVYHIECWKQMNTYFDGFVFDE